MKDLANNISKGKNLEISLPKFGQEMMSTYYKYSSVRLAMNYYTFSEMQDDKIEENDGEFYRLVSLCKGVIDDGIKTNVIGDELETKITVIDSIRNDIIKVMKGLTSLVDVFNIYEYILNRMEYRFKDASHVNLKDDESFSREIIKYILAGDDNALINLKITEAVRQLPLRMTKSRFFELLKEGLKVYKDSEKSNFDDFVYMLSSSSLIYIDEYADKVSDDINKIIVEFKNADYSSLDEDAYNKLRDKLNYAVDFVQKSVDEYLSLTELVNDIYVLLLATPYSDVNCEEKKILDCILDMPEDGSAEEALVKLEGRQERYHESFLKYEYLIQEISTQKKDLIESLMLSALYNSLDVVALLESGSQFVEFNKEVNKDIAEEAYIEEKYNELESKLTAFFKDNNKLVNRAIMAHVLASLPIFFNNAEEIQNYIFSSINGCTDIAEKTACAEIFATMMEEDGFNVVS